MSRAKHDSRYFFLTRLRTVGMRPREVISPRPDAEAVIRYRANMEFRDNFLPFFHVGHETPLQF